MRKISIVVYLMVVGLMISAETGCAKREEPEQKPQVRAQEKASSEKAAKAPPTPQEIPTPSDAPITEERVIFSFENDLKGWEIPYWALEKDDHVTETLELSQDIASEGAGSMKANCNFPGGRWTASVIEIEQYFDLSPYREIAVDVYIPEKTPLGLRSKLILTVGENWKFTEMNRGIPLVPGEWVTIKASIEPGSYDWKRTVPDESFRADVRKIVIRTESNKRPVYKGPIYIDNLRIGK